MGGLAGIAGMAATAVAAGCTPKSPGSPTETDSGDSGLELPTHIRLTDVTPDLPGDGGHVPDTFLTLPADPVKVSEGPPGDGSDVKVGCMWIGVVPPPLGQNQYWQELNSRLGVNLDFQAVPSGEYSARAAAVLSGGDIPDIMQFPNGMARVPEVLAAQFADLTEYVSGDNIQQWPLLANLPTAVWEQSVYNGRIYGVRSANPSFGLFLLANEEILDDLGISVDQVTDSESLRDLCREVTSDRDTQWASPSQSGMLAFVTEMLGKPADLNWFQEGGTFVHVWETDEYRQGLEFVAQLQADGVFHPDALGLSGSDQIAQFTSRRAVLDYRAGLQWGTRTTENNEGVTVTAIPPVDFNGDGMGVKGLLSGTYTMAAINKDADPDRIRMLLGVMDWLAAPAGSEEYEFRKFGIEGVHHERTSDGDLALTAAGGTEIKLPTSYINNAPYVNYVPGHPEVATAMYEFIKLVTANGVQDATLGLWSDAANANEATLKVAVEETRDNIFRGTGTLGDFDAAVDEWRTAGGDEIRREYEEAFAALQ